MIDLYKLLETLEMTVSYLPVKTATLSEVEETIAELRQALAQPEQKPVAKVKVINEDIWGVEWLDRPPLNDTSLYTAPPERKWQGLTNEEIFEHEWWDEETAFAVNKELMEKNNVL